MHELGVANEILDVALSEAERHAAKKVTSIRLRVGVLRSIEPENLFFLFDHIARGTPAEGAVLEIVEEPVRVECEACGVSEASSFTWECPRCKGSGVKVTGGDSLSILSLDVDS
ncbi:hydrogenase maturation nickel metallochaperone HypA [Candidatus Deferrimicrobium sp.]|uniref:hydrogenase maturation nickel metallochaperone HypA n=1 Tax=Candidatus Deferrimicrobium sp. TaxID=3060586 RepID=UPI002ED1B756